MKRVFYAGTSLLTTDRIASALLDLPVRLAGRSVVEHVAVPCRADDGGVITVELVVGAASELLSLPADGTDTIDGDLVLLSERSASPAESPTATDSAVIFYDFDEWF